jgi:hypothetical protein
VWPGNVGSTGDAALSAAELQRLGARARTWSAPAAVGPHGVRCGVSDGVVLFRLPSGARFARPVRVSSGFATRLVRFDEAVQRRARELLGSPVARIEHLGAYVCRTVKGTAGSPSEHASGDAVDISAFVLRNGRRITVQRDFARAGADPTSAAARFLRAVLDDLRSERTFGTILTPDFNRAHHNHLHLDGRRWPWWPPS